MNIRRIIFLLAIIMGALLVALSFWRRKAPVEIPQLATAPTQQPAADTNQPVFISTASTNAAPQTKNQQMIERFADSNDQPIEFYGRLQDQFGNPIVGAQIDAAIRIYNATNSTVEHLKTESDAAGLFQITGKKGESLSVVPRKSGYALASLNGGGIYSAVWPEEQRVHPDANKPAIIKMWKLQGEEPLAQIDQHYMVPVNGAPVNIDLLSGKVVPDGGDLKITVNRPPGIVSQRNPQDWSMRIEVIGGGLIKTSVEEARITYAAPNSGYQPEDVIVQSTTNHWSNLAQQMFFVSSRTGQIYSKVSLSFGINANPDGYASLTLRGVANENSSRNWEADPNTYNQR